LHVHDTPNHERETKAVARDSAPEQAPSSSPAALLALQRAAGNAAVTGLIQRAAAHDVLSSPGRPLDAPTRADMEARLGADFSDVRVHNDAAAQRSAAELGARAYTSGHHVVIGNGGTDRHTLAHELTHVIQQRSGPVAGTVQGNGLSVSDPGDTFERAAEANARRAMSGAAPEVQHASPSHHGGTAPIQRMTVQDFDNHVATTAVAGNAAFTEYVQFRLGQDDPAAVVTNAANPAARLTQLLAPPTVTTALLDQYVQDFQALGGGQHTPPQPLNNPNVTGLEMELGYVRLEFPSGSQAADGQVLAQTTGNTPAGPPIMKLEIEGLTRMTPPGAIRKTSNIEIIYGPLPTANYNRTPLVDARNKLHEALRKRGRVNALITAYNNTLGANQQQYRLVATPLAATANKAPSPVTTPAAAEARTNNQTNVSVPYDKLGTPDANQAGDFSGFFENDDVLYYDRARTEAATMATLIDQNWAAWPGNNGQTVGPNINSLLTQIVYHEAKYLEHTLVRDQPQTGDKHHFHVMLKLSPQDVVMSIISDDEARLLLAWLANGHANDIANAVAATYAVKNPTQQLTVNPQDLHRYLVQVLVARLIAGRQLLPAPGPQQATVVNAANQAVGQVAHAHPRPTNRIPIRVNNGRYYMVVEQRVATHDLNRNNVSRQDKVNQITNLQT
jgi:hypothetical protein